MLSFRRETEYAIQLLTVLSRSKISLSINQISDRIGVSFLFLQKIARKLRNAGLIVAAKGVNGGYRLTKDGRHINLRKVVAVVEADCSLLPCCRTKYKCQKGGRCALKGKIATVNNEINKMLEKIKISDL